MRIIILALVVLVLISGCGEGKNKEPVPPEDPGILPDENKSPQGDLNRFVQKAVQPDSCEGCNGLCGSEIGLEGCFNSVKLFGQMHVGETSEDTTVPNRIYHASGIAIDTGSKPNKVYVVDTGNNRVLGFKGIGYCESGERCTNDSDCNGECSIDPNIEPDIIFGQENGYRSACNRNNNLGVNSAPSEDTLCFIGYPETTNIQEYWMRYNIDVDEEGNLYVPDVYNNRVLKFNNPFGTGVGEGDNKADFVWGQQGFEKNGINAGMGKEIRNDESLFFSFGGRGFDHVSARGVSVDKKGNVWVADTFNRRILMFEQGSEKAKIVLGQKNFLTSDARGCRADAPLDSMCTPTLAKVDPETGKLWVIDERPAGFKARFLVFSPPFRNGMEAEKVVKAKQGKEPEDFDPNYEFRTSGFEFNTYKEGKYANGKLWITQDGLSRAALIDEEGNIIGVIGSKGEEFKGCNYDYYRRCGTSIFENFNLCALGSSPALDDEGNVYFADEHRHAIGIIGLPYERREVDGEICIEEAKGGILGDNDNDPNSVSPAGFKTSVGAVAFGNQLVVKDKRRYLVWNNYQGKDIVAGKADLVVGQENAFEREGNDLGLGGRAFHTIDDENRLWTLNAHGKIIVFQLPFKGSDEPLANFVELFWEDGEKVDYRAYGGIVFDEIDGQIWLSDRENHRVLRIKNPENFKGKLYVDAVLGQNSKEGNKCNFNQEEGWIAPGNPEADSICRPYQLEFDNFGNLYVVENDYECHGNNRIIVFMRDKIDSINTLFPGIGAEKVFVSSSFTQKAQCTNFEDAPQSPVSIAFNSKNNMVVGNDGYYPIMEERAYRQLWFYNDPLKKEKGQFVQGQKPDYAIKLPLGSAGEINFDGEDNLIVQDHTWPRVWVINLEMDPAWLVEN